MGKVLIIKIITKIQEYISSLRKVILKRRLGIIIH